MCSSDVEVNPGPEVDRKTAHLKVISYNVRGLNDENKMRHLLNYFHRITPGKNSDFIAGMQETYLEKEGKIPYLWRGNFYMTPGQGNGRGCVTFLSPHLNIVASESLDDRAHILAVQRSGEAVVSYIIANLYAPCPNTVEKIEFFEKVFELLQDYEDRYNCTNSLILGDFNLNLEPSEMKNRMFSVQEQRVAKVLKDLYSRNGLADLWQTKREFTWRRANTEMFSTIDRILYNPGAFEIVNMGTNWSLSLSDHAAVEVQFALRGKESNNRSRVTRLDPTLARIPECRVAIVAEVEQMLNDTPQGWDPHLKLEYAKMCIRTVVEKVQADRKKKDK